MGASIRAALMALTLASAASTFASRAMAEPTAEQRAMARSLFDQAREDMKRRDFAAACPKLDQSQKLDPGTGTLFNLANCYENLGRVASAWTMFGEVADASRADGRADRESVARERAAGLLSRLPRVRVTASLVDGLILTLDGTPFAVSLLGSEVPLDPGSHVVAASAPGHVSRSMRFQAKEGETVQVTLPALGLEPSGPVVQPRTKGPGWHAPLAWVAGGLGVAALGVGTVFGAKALGAWSTAKPDCGDGNCITSAAYSDWKSAHSDAAISTYAFVAAGVCVAAGAAIWLTRPSSPTQVGVGPGIVTARLSWP